MTDPLINLRMRGKCHTAVRSCLGFLSCEFFQVFIELFKGLVHGKLSLLSIKKTSTQQTQHIQNKYKKENRQVRPKNKQQHIQTSLALLHIPNKNVWYTAKILEGVIVYLYIVPKLIPRGHPFPLVITQSTKHTFIRCSCSHCIDPFFHVW